jgi:hypothetical protein
MWKTPGRFWALIGAFLHIVASKRADNHCAAVDFLFFRKPQVVPVQALTTAGADGSDGMMD